MCIEDTHIAAVVVNRNILVIFLENHASMGSILTALEGKQLTSCKG